MLRVVVVDGVAGEPLEPKRGVHGEMLMEDGQLVLVDVMVVLRRRGGCGMEEEAEEAVAGAMKELVVEDEDSRRSSPSPASDSPVYKQLVLEDGVAGGALEPKRGVHGEMLLQDGQLVLVDVMVVLRRRGGCGMEEEAEEAVAGAMKELVVEDGDSRRSSPSPALDSPVYKQLVLD